MTGITSCIDKYWPNVDKYEHVLVVDGLLNNGDNPVLVKLSYSSSINTQLVEPVTGAELYITDEQQMETPLIESEPGTYVAADSTFRGVVGKSYQLHIHTNGQEYVSNLCNLPAPSPIDSIYSIRETHASDVYNETVYGIQFYIDNHSDYINDTSYYIWRLTETYKYMAAFSIDYLWEGEFIPYPNPDSLRTCWKTSTPQKIYLQSTKYYDLPVLKKIPLNYVSTETKALSIRYSLLIKQLNVSKDAFDFYYILQQQNADQEDLYSKQPYQVRGNIVNTKNPDEPVLGYFIVSGITEQRFYLDRPNILLHYYVCVPDTESMRYLKWVPKRFWPIYITIIEGGYMAQAVRMSCFDCRLEGGTLTRPDFWMD